MNVYCCIFVTFMIVWTTQARRISVESRQLWRPETGTRGEWLRCQGVPCDQWNRTQHKLAQLKAYALADEHAFDHSTPPRESGTPQEGPADRLDDCIVLTEQQVDELLSDQRNAVHGRRRRATRYINFRRWTVMPIPWKFDGKHTESQKSKIRSAFQHWTDHTCIRFRELGTNERISSNHILVTGEGGGCYSNVGMVDRIPQALNLQPSCITDFGTPVHEIGHSLGLWHEQQRWDRDDVIKVLKQNIGYYGGQFLKLYGTDTSLPYDVGSVMHYGPKSGSKNGENTMETVNPLYQRNMGQRTGLSYLDAKAINLAYCSATCPNRLARPCERDGYQDPNHCDRCKCPEGFRGTFCHEVASSVNAVCGGVLRATSTPQYIKTPGYDTDRYYSNKQQCSWLIQAPANHRVVLNFEGEFGIYCHNSGQCHHWVEVRTGTNLGRQGPRFCCYRIPEDVLRSETGEMAVVFRTNWNVPWKTAKRGFKASFVAEPMNGAIPVPTTKRTTVPTTTTTPTTTTKATTTTWQTPHGSTSIWRCSFEDDSGKKTLCGMRQLTSDQFDWTVRSGKTPSDETGPSSAYRGSRPNYIYIEASSPRRLGDEAIVMIPRLYSNGDHCVTFNYHMYGFHVNELRLARNTSWGQLETVWRQRKDHGNRWLSARVDVIMGSYDKLAFIGVVGHEFSGDIALDDIDVKKGRC
ncbi:Zinc metalloproteinase nas-36 [Lamellibrachia satsuma]|nr:Zinc metalloproteinase nas-36 [Lamellibrachia satsuma]